MINEIEIVEQLPSSNNIIYLCRCYCGKLFKARKTRLVHGITKSCGCHMKKHLQEQNNKKALPKRYEDSLEHKFPHLMYEWDYVKNNISPSNIRAGSSKKVWWKCLKCQHEWMATVSSRTYNNTGCDKCVKSKSEKIISDYLRLRGIKFEAQKTFDGCRNKQPLRFDFYIPEFNLCIEYNGEQHYSGWRLKDKERSRLKLLETIINDCIKRNFCQQNGIDLIEIPYTEINNLELILSNIIRSFMEDYE